MNESNIHRIPVKPAATVKPGVASVGARQGRLLLAVGIGLALVGAAVYLSGLGTRSEEAEPPWLAKSAKPSEESPPPPAGLTADRAFALAEERLKDGARSGASLAESRRLATWAAALGASAAQTEDLNGRIEQQLEARWRRGRFAFLHARKLRNAVAADAALRALRETFPADDARSREIDRMEATR